MSISKALLYLGKDEGFLEDLNAFILKHDLKDYLIKTSPSSTRNLGRKAIGFSPNIIFYDFEGSTGLLADHLRLLKDCSALSSTLIVVLFKDQNIAWENSHLLATGAEIFFVKGTDHEYLFRDCFRTMFDDYVKLPAFAKAKELSLQATAGAISSLTAFSSSDLYLDSDIDLRSDDVVKLVVPFLGLKVLEYRTIDVFPKSNFYPFLGSYQLGHPLPQPWEDVDEDALTLDRLETWQNFHAENFDVREKFVYIVSKEICQKIINIDMLNDLPCFIELYDSSRSFELHDGSPKKPLVIFYELSDDSADLEDIEDLRELASVINAIDDYAPIIIVTNSTSSSEALKKITSYENLMAVSQKLDTSLVCLFTKKLKRSSEEPSYIKYFSPNDTAREVLVNIDIVFTEFTEREISFRSRFDLPLFTVLKLNLPIPLFLTIVPPLYPLGKKEGYQHYFGIIHGLDEDRLVKMRKLVNQLMYHSIKEINEDVVSNLLRQAPIPDPVSNGVTLNKPSEMEDERISAIMTGTSEATTNGRFKIKRTKMYSRTKL